MSTGNPLSSFVLPGAAPVQRPAGTAPKYPNPTNAVGKPIPRVTSGTPRRPFGAAPTNAAGSPAQTEAIVQLRNQIARLESDKAALAGELEDVRAQLTAALDTHAAIVETRDMVATLLGQPTK